MADDKMKSLLDRFDEAKDRAATRAAGAAAKRTIGKLADGLLDELEELLLGEKGAAEEILAKERGVDPLERIRDAYGVEEEEVEGEVEVGGGEVKVSPAEEKRAKALAELQRLKAVRAAMESDEMPETPTDAEADDEPPARPAKARRRL
jgi:hypothetical protein